MEGIAVRSMGGLFHTHCLRPLVYLHIDVFIESISFSE